MGRRRADVQGPIPLHLHGTARPSSDADGAWHSGESLQLRIDPSADLDADHGRSFCTQHITSNPAKQVIHSAEYKSRSQLTGKKVLILGTGETGMDLAYESVHAGAKEVFLCSRGGFLSFPKILNNFSLFGMTFDGKLPIDSLITNLCESAYVHPWVAQSHLRWFVSDFVIKRVLWFLTGTQAGCNQWVGELPQERLGRVSRSDSLALIPQEGADLPVLALLVGLRLPQQVPQGHALPQPTLPPTLLPPLLDLGVPRPAGRRRNGGRGRDGSVPRVGGARGGRQLGLGQVQGQGRELDAGCEAAGAQEGGARVSCFVCSSWSSKIGWTDAAICLFSLVIFATGYRQEVRRP